MNEREAYRTLIQPLSVEDVARELGVVEGFVEQQIRSGHLKALPDGQVTGSELAAYLAARRRGQACGTVLLG
jgi:hypothetical protein